MDNHIYSIPNEEKELSSVECSKEADIEKKFVEKIAELVCAAMDIAWNDRRVVQALLVQMLNGYLEGRNGLLQQYLAHELEEIATHIKNNLRIPKEVKVDHDNATHAKFVSICDYIANNFVKIDDIKSDGTFTKINEKGLYFDLDFNSTDDNNEDMGRPQSENLE